MARKSATFPLYVTAIMREDGSAINGMVITCDQDVRDFLLPGPRLTDGVIVESGYSDLICEECGETAAWCPRLMAALPMSWVTDRRDAECMDVPMRHVDGLVTFGS